MMVSFATPEFEAHARHPDTGPESGRERRVDGAYRHSAFRLSSESNSI